MGEKLRTASLRSKYTGSYKKKSVISTRAIQNFILQTGLYTRSSLHAKVFMKCIIAQLRKCNKSSVHFHALMCISIHAEMFHSITISSDMLYISNHTAIHQTVLIRHRTMLVPTRVVLVLACSYSEQTWTEMCSVITFPRWKCSMWILHLQRKKAKCKLHSKTK